MSRKRIGLIALYSLTSLLALTCALGAITSFAYENKVLPRTMVAGVEIGNLTYNQAIQTIADKGSELTKLKISFSIDDKSANTTLAELGVDVDEESVLAEVIRPANAFDWVKPSYWRAMFTNKNVGFSYSADTIEVRKKVESALGITTAARDAQINFESGQLKVVEAQKGISVSDAAIDSAISSVLVSGYPILAKLEFTEQSPNITTDVATATIDTVHKQLLPIYLQFENLNFTLSPATQTSFLQFTATNGQFSWQPSPEKIKSYLSGVVSKKVNIAMLPKTIQFDTQQVTQEGRDGREADLTQLAQDISRTITERIDTTSTPITINTRVIAFTEKIIYPGYIAGLYPGLYIDINLVKQRLYVMEGTTKVAEYLISSGKRGTPTPVGLFFIKNKLELAQSRLFPGIWMEKWNALARSPDGSGYQGYGLHRIPCFDAACNIRESSAHLGTPVSHGCVRIENAGADWVYDNAPVGTPVNIHT